ncbi:CDP-alcohol phosphatidyltransferase family protein [bacterium]|nr:CDP-alcohol phosphatidyltransferase family protein [bacterium]
MENEDKKKSSEGRVQTSLLADVERKLLLWMAPRLPQWVAPDMLTFLGLFAMAGVGLSYYLVSYHRLYLILASVGFIINWFGDSLDGTLARVRNQQRPKYGYYLDHLVDAFGFSFVIFGLAYSKMISQPFVWLVLVLFFIASINTYLATNSVHVFKISYSKISTTEARIILVILNTILLFINKVTIFSFESYFLDIIAGIVSLFLFVVTLRSAILNLRKLNLKENMILENQNR